jgi:hypothetical protein
MKQKKRGKELIFVFLFSHFVAALRELKEESSIDLLVDFPSVYAQTKQEPHRSFPVGKKIVYVCLVIRVFLCLSVRCFWSTIQKE